LGGEGSHGVEVGQVQHGGNKAGRGEKLADSCGGIFGFVHATRGQDHLGTLAGEFQCGVPADAAVGPGDNDTTPGLGRDVSCGPFGFLHASKLRTEVSDGN
jgi:hypothetical protein